MEQEITTPYKSNFTLGILFTILSLVGAAGNIINLFAGFGSCQASLGGLFSSILLLVWFYRSHKNLVSYNSMGLKYSPGWAVGSFFVPILNIFRPYQIAQEIWKASDPEASTVSWKQSKPGIVVILWWLSALIFYFTYLSIMGYAMWVGIQSVINGIEPEATQYLAASTPLFVGYLVYCILSISLVYRVNDRQEEKAETFNLI